MDYEYIRKDGGRSMENSCGIGITTRPLSNRQQLELTGMTVQRDTTIDMVTNDNFKFNEKWINRDHTVDVRNTDYATYIRSLSLTPVDQARMLHESLKIPEREHTVGHQDDLTNNFGKSMTNLADILTDALPAHLSADYYPSISETASVLTEIRTASGKHGSSSDYHSTCRRLGNAHDFNQLVYTTGLMPLQEICKSEIKINPQNGSDHFPDKNLSALGKLKTEFGSKYTLEANIITYCFDLDLIAELHQTSNPHLVKLLPIIVEAIQAISVAFIKWIDYLISAEQHRKNVCRLLDSRGYSLNNPAHLMDPNDAKQMCGLDDWNAVDNFIDNYIQNHI